MLAVLCLKCEVLSCVWSLITKRFLYQSVKVHTSANAHRIPVYV